MLTQQIRISEMTNSGTLTITAEPGRLAELIGLQQELALRTNVQTEGDMIELPAAPEEGGPHPA